MGFVRTVVHRQVVGYINRVVQARLKEDSRAAERIWDRRQSQEDDLFQKEQAEFARCVLEELDEADRELLERFYVRHQTPERICTDLGMTATQFRLRKSRAKAKFSRLGQERLHPTIRVRLRTSG